MRLTDGEHNILSQLSLGHELVQSVPGGWWINSSQVSGRVGWSLFRKMLVRTEYESNSDDYFVYLISQEGRDALFQADEVRDLIKKRKKQNVNFHSY